MKVSIVIPVHGRLDLLFETLASVHAQEGGFAKQVILIDDASPEPIEPEVRRRFPDVTVIRNEENLRQAGARNRGLDAVDPDADYVAILDSDDLWEPRFLLAAIAAIERDDAAAAVALSRTVFSPDLPLAQRARLTLLTGARDLFQVIFHALHRGTLPRSAFYLCQLSHVVFRASALSGVRFDAGYSPSCDWHFVINASASGPVRVVRERLVRYRYHRAQKSADAQELAGAWEANRRLIAEARRHGIEGPMLRLLEGYCFAFERVDRWLGRW